MEPSLPVLPSPPFSPDLPLPLSLSTELPLLILPSPCSPLTSPASKKQARLAKSVSPASKKRARQGDATKHFHQCHPSPPTPPLLSRSMYSLSPPAPEPVSPLHSTARASIGSTPICDEKYDDPKEEEEVEVATKQLDALGGAQEEKQSNKGEEPEQEEESKQCMFEEILP